MKVNEGTLDRVIRVVVGLGLLSLTAVGPETSLGFVGIIPLVTGVVGYCPVYDLLGIRTCPAQAASK